MMKTAHLDQCTVKPTTVETKFCSWQNFQPTFKHFILKCEQAVKDHWAFEESLHVKNRQNKQGSEKKNLEKQRKHT